MQWYVTQNESEESKRGRDKENIDKIARYGEHYSILCDKDETTLQNEKLRRIREVTYKRHAIIRTENGSATPSDATVFLGWREKEIEWEIC